MLDDIPVQSNNTVSGTVDEDELTGQSTGNTDNDSETTIATGTLASLVQAGVDEPGSFSFKSALSGLPAVTSAGETVLYSVSGTVLTGYVEAAGGAGFQAGDRAVFTLDVQPNGTFTFTLLDQIDHVPNVPANNDDQTRILDFTSAIQYTDYDGDTISFVGPTTTTTVTTGVGLHSGHYVPSYTVGGVTFNGLVFTGSAANTFNNPDDTNTDPVNVSGPGIGIGDNHIQDNEGLVISKPGTDFVSFQINGSASGTISWVAYSGGFPVSGSPGSSSGSVPGGIPANGSIVTINPTGTFDHIVVRFDMAGNDKIRIDNFNFTSTVTTNGGVFTIAVEDDLPKANVGNVTVGTVHEDGLLPGGNTEGGSQPVSINITTANLVRAPRGRRR